MIEKGFQSEAKRDFERGFQNDAVQREKKKRLDNVVCLQKQGRHFRMPPPYRGNKKKKRA